jgi:hypothetical protein
MVYGGILIHFPYENPFFSDSRSFLISITEDISPYGIGVGGLSVSYQHKKRLMPNIDLFTLRVKIPDAPDAAKLINEQLDAWTEGFPGDSETSELLKGFVKWFECSEEYPYRLQPQYGQWKNFFSVSYPLQTYDGPSYNMPVLYSICFDITQGELVDLTDFMPSGLPFADGSVFSSIRGFQGSISDGGGGPAQEYYDNYTPPKGSAVSEAWIVGDMLGMHIIEPDGKKVQVFFFNNWR